MGDDGERKGDDVKLPTIDDHVRAMYPVLRMACQPLAPEGITLPATFDECDDPDKEHLRGLVREAMREVLDAASADGPVAVLTPMANSAE